MDTDTLRARDAFGTAKSGIKVFGALGTLALLAVLTVALGGHPVNAFMWVRALLLPGIAVLLHRMTGSAARGSRRAYERVSTLAAVMPISIIAVDLVPGVCPPWYAVTQAVCMLPVGYVAVLTRRPALRAAFPKGR